MKQKNLSKIAVLSNRFQALTDEEMAKVNGGIVPAVVLGCAVFGYTVGKDLAKKFKK